MIPDNFVGKMPKQLGLTGPEFRLLVRCDLTRENYALKVESGDLRPISR